MPVVQFPGYNQGLFEGGSDGGDGGPGLDARLQQVERAVDRLTVQVDHVARDSTEIKAVVSTYKWQIFGAVVALSLTVFGTAFAIQQMTVATFVAAIQLQSGSTGQTAIAPKPPQQAASAP